MKAVMYGAGNIGRGFIGQVFHDSGYEVVFIDVKRDVVSALNERRQYPLNIVSHEGVREVLIDNVRAVDGTDAQAVAQEIASCDIMATAVGVNVLPFIAPNIAKGIEARGDRPLNIIICENLMDSADVLRGLIGEHISDAALLDNVGLIEASIGRMVPIMTPEMQQGDILLQWTEPYCELPLDEKGFIGPIPALKYIVPFTPFRFYEERKLYIHNLGHASAAYLGNLRGYEYIWQAIADPEIEGQVRLAMQQSALAISHAYGVELSTLEAHIDDLLFRFTNKALMDTVSRVGRDPLRKLKPADRFQGAIERCAKEGVDNRPILVCMAAALKFQRADDTASQDMQQMIAAEGVEAFLTHWSKLSSADAHFCAVALDQL